MIYALPRALVCFLLSVLVSTIVIRYLLAGLRKGPDGPEETHELSSAGFWLGLFETVPIFVFVIEREYTAVAVLLAAKLLVGRDLTPTRPTHYYAGTFCNFAIAILFAVLARIWMSEFLAMLLV
jgi:hypothetical protein